MSPMVDEGNQDESLVRLGELARRAWPDAAPAAVSANGKRQLKAAAGRARAAAPKRWVTLGLACSAIVALGVALFRYWPSSLDYSVESPSPSAGGYLQATKQAPAVAHFTDGTDVRIDRGARARIVDVDRNGARVALEQGHARLRVAHRPSARWSVDAGPFSIAVTGTDFDVDWSSSDGVLVVELRAGGVIVRGPLAADGIGVHAGQRLVASLTESRLHIEAVGAARASASEPPTPAPDVAAMVPTATDRDAPAPPVERAVPPVSWPKRVAAGDFSAVIADARARGLSVTLAQAPLSDLVALADAARYTGKLDIAREALTAQRNRYPGSTDAKAAAFLLGRLAEDRGAVAEALSWYERYLSEAPRGAFGAEALGRRMLATKRARRPGAAISLAREYLERFPEGPYADRARELAALP